MREKHAHRQPHTRPLSHTQSLRQTHRILIHSLAAHSPPAHRLQQQSTEVPILRTMDLAPSEQVVQAARCLLLLSRNTFSRKFTASHNNASDMGIGHRNESLKSLSHFQSCVRQDSTGDYSGSDRQSPSSSCDSSGGPERVSQSCCRGSDGAVDLTAFRTRTMSWNGMRNMRSERIGAAGPAPISHSPPSHQTFALVTHKQDDLIPADFQHHLKHQQQDRQHAVQHRDRSGSLSDHSPFMIARIMTDLYQYRQQDPTARHPDPGTRCCPDSLAAESGSDPGIQCSTHSPLSNGSRRPHRRLLSPARLALVSGKNQGSGGADPLLPFMQLTAAAEAVISASAASSPRCEIPDQMSPRTHSCAVTRNKRRTPVRKGTANKRQRKTTASCVEPESGIVGESGDRVEGQAVVGGKSADCGVNRLNERQCKHACPFPGCDKVYGKILISFSPSSPYATPAATGGPSQSWMQLTLFPFSPFLISAQESPRT